MGHKVYAIQVIFCFYEVFQNLLYQEVFVSWFWERVVAFQFKSPVMDFRKSINRQFNELPL